MVSNIVLIEHFRIVSDFDIRISSLRTLSMEEKKHPLFSELSTESEGSPRNSIYC
jgi:hypothetical protein